MQHSFAPWRWLRPAWLGLSVNTQSMTLVEWRPGHSVPPTRLRWGQETWAVEAFGADSADPWADPNRLGLAVQALAHRVGLRCRRLAMGMAAHQVVQQRMQLEAGLPLRELRAQVNWHASQALGLAWNEVAFDYRLEPQDAGVSHGPAEPLALHWVACPMARVHAAQQMSRAAGLHLQFLGLAPEPFCLSPQAQVTAPERPAQWHLACDMARQGAQA